MFTFYFPVPRNIPRNTWRNLVSLATIELADIATYILMGLRQLKHLDPSGFSTQALQFSQAIGLMPVLSAYGL